MQNSRASILISEDDSLKRAVEQLTMCGPAYTLFARNLVGELTGVLTSGDIMRVLRREEGSWPDGIIKDAMTPRSSMIYIYDRGHGTWYAQITKHRKTDEARQGDHRRWLRIKLVPVLDNQHNLVDILDIGSPKLRTRLESLVMTEAFPLKSDFSYAALNRRRSEFDSIHYKTHFQKVRGLCNVLSYTYGGDMQMLDDVFESGRADELVHALGRAEEWMQEHVPEADISPEEGITKKDRRDLLVKLSSLRERLAQKYLQKSHSGGYFPMSADASARDNPQVIVVLGCKEEAPLLERTRAAFDVVGDILNRQGSPIVVLSGGGIGHDVSEARAMFNKLLSLGASEIPNDDTSLNPGRFIRLQFPSGKYAEVMLEEDSLDTLGNAVFTWFALKISGRFGMEADGAQETSSVDKAKAEALQRLLLITDRIHAPRSYDIFRRIFAFRGAPERVKVVVKTVEQDIKPNDGQTALVHLRSESQTNGEVFRLVNLLTNGYDVIADGHGRSILGQMLRLHKMYYKRWDLVRKYREAWSKSVIGQ